MHRYKSSDDFHIVRYADSDFVGSLDNMKLTASYVFKMVGDFSWKSVSKQ